MKLNEEMGQAKGNIFVTKLWNLPTQDVVLTTSLAGFKNELDQFSHGEQWLLALMTV